MQGVDCDVDVGTLGNGDWVFAEGTTTAGKYCIGFGVAGVNGNDRVKAECFFGKEKLVSSFPEERKHVCL